MFKKKRKLFTGIVIANAMIFCLNAQLAVAYANVNNLGAETIAVQSVNIASIEANLSIGKSGLAKVVANVYGKGGTDKINMSVYLQKYDTSTDKWKTLKTWNMSRNASILSFCEDYSLSDKGTYRCKCKAIITKDSVAETISFNSEKRKYS